MDIRKISNRECATCAIRHNTLCAKCEGEELDVLNTMKYFRSYEAGQNVVWAGDRMDFVATISSGVASMNQTLEDGRTQMVGLLLTNDFMGHPGRELAPFDVVATTDITLCCFRKKAFEATLVEIPHVAQRLLQMTMSELDAAREWMLLLGRKTAREKIASLLVIIARRTAKADVDADNGSIVFDLPLTRVAMSDYLGLTLETVSRQITSLRKAGIISIENKRHITAPDFRKLVAVSGGDLKEYA